jgi:hypothetical protein
MALCNDIQQHIIIQTLRNNTRHCWELSHAYLKYRIMPSCYLKLSSPPEKISFACLGYLT